MMQWLLHAFPQAAAVSGWSDQAAADGRLDIVQWVHADLKIDMWTARAIDEAAKHDRLDVVKWLHENTDAGATVHAMNGAAKNGHLDIVQWLHDTRSEGCTSRAIDLAVANGHFSVVQWLHANRLEGCSARAMDLAALNGHLEIVKWLHLNRADEGCTMEAMDMAASSGHLDVVQWLHEHRSEGCTTNAMDLAARSGHLSVVKWLHENRTEGCTILAIDRTGSLAVVQWLHENRIEGWTAFAMENAAFRGLFEQLLFLHANRSEGCTDSTALFALLSKNFEIFQWVRAKYPERIDLNQLTTRCREVALSLTTRLLGTSIDSTQCPEFNSLQVTATITHTVIKKVQSIWTLKTSTHEKCPDERDISFSSAQQPSKIADNALRPRPPAQPTGSSTARFIPHLAAIPSHICSKDLMTSATAPQHVAPLTSALVVCRARELQALTHVTDLVSTFLDYATPARCSIMRACELNDLRLLKRVAARDSQDIDPHYKASLAAEALTAAVRNDNLEIVNWLCQEYCPSILPVKAIQEAARLEKFTILDWFFTIHRNASCKKRVASDAIQSGNVKMLRMVLPHIESAELVAEFISRAASYCDFETVKYLHERVLHLQIDPSSSSLLTDVLRNGIYTGNLELAQWLFSCDYRLEMETGRLSLAAQDGDLEMVQWLFTLPQAKGSTGWIDEAAGAGKLQIVQWVHDIIKDDVCTVYAMDEAAYQGHLHVIQWLHENRTEGCTTRAMDNAAGNQRLDIIQWLHEHRSEGCTTAAMNIAAWNGHFDVMLWLHEHRSEGCTTEAMDSAASLGRFEMLQWLHTNRTEGCTTAAMDKTAAGGHLDILQWLHENRSEGCTTDAMDYAAENGHLHVVKWLHKNRSEGCTTYAMDHAFSLEIVQWLHENRSEGCTERAMEFAASRGMFKTVLFLHANRSEGCTENTALYALVSNYVEIFQWVCTNYPERVNLDEIMEECTGPEYEYLSAAIAQLRIQ